MLLRAKRIPLAAGTLRPVAPQRELEGLGRIKEQQCPHIGQGHAVKPPLLQPRSSRARVAMQAVSLPARGPCLRFWEIA